MEGRIGKVIQRIHDPYGPSPTFDEMYVVHYLGMRRRKWPISAENNEEETSSKWIQ